MESVTRDREAESATVPPSLDPLASAEVLEGQARVVSAFQTALCQHQRSVDQAFTSLVNACHALNAAVATGGPSAPSSSTATATGGLPSSSQSSSASLLPPLKLYGQLLHRVELVHTFLFTNLYMHQRESVLQLLSGVEECVLSQAVRASSTRESTHERAGDGSNAPPDNVAADIAAAQRELRQHIAQLRHSLLRAPPAHREGRVVMPADTTADVSLAQDAVVSASSSAGASKRSSTRDAPLLAFSQTASSPRAPRRSGPSASAARRPLFGLSSAFFASGSDGQRSLTTVMACVQQRLRVHVVTLSNTNETLCPVDEVQAAVELGCLCLVVPHHIAFLYPKPSPLFVISDLSVLTYMDPHHDSASSSSSTTGASSAEATAMQRLDSDEDDEEAWRGEDGGCAELPSTLDELFLSLEADLPAANADPPPLWSPAFATADSTNSPTHTKHEEARVVQRAALRRNHGGGLLTQRAKRQRTGTAPPTASKTDSSPPHSTSSSAAVGTLSHSVHGESSLHDGQSDNLPLSEPQVMESQHVGITQYGPSTLSANSGRPSEPTTPPIAVAASVTPLDSVAQPDANAPAGTVPVFQISNSVKYLKPQLMEAIQQLGGVVDQSSGYSRGCRYLIVAEGITERTEKYLGACAAAAYIVPPRFVFDSQRRGYWLTNRVREYDMSPQRGVAHRPQAKPVFHNWRVVLITSRSAAARGVRAALLAGGCTHATAFVVDLTAEVPIGAAALKQPVFDDSCAVDGVVEGVGPTGVIEASVLASATHILLECSSVTAQGCFQVPDWVPPCVRRPGYAGRMFTLELLYFCLCAHPERVFDAEGQLSEVGALTPACRVEPLP